MVKNVLIIIIILGLIGFVLYKTNNEKNVLKGESASLLETHNDLLQVRILMVDLLTMETENNYVNNEVLSHLEAASTNAKTNINNKGLNDYAFLKQKTLNLTNDIELFAINANQSKSANQEQALTLLTDLTNLILEFQFELTQLGFQFPPLLFPQSQ